MANNNLKGTKGTEFHSWSPSYRFITSSLLGVEAFLGVSCQDWAKLVSMYFKTKSGRIYEHQHKSYMWHCGALERILNAERGKANDLVACCLFL